MYKKHKGKENVEKLKQKKPTGDMQRRKRHTQTSISEAKKIADEWPKYQPDTAPQWDSPSQRTLFSLFPNPVQCPYKSPVLRSIYAVSSSGRVSVKPCHPHASNQTKGRKRVIVAGSGMTTWSTKRKKGKGPPETHSQWEEGESRCSPRGRDTKD